MKHFLQNHAAKVVPEFGCQVSESGIVVVHFENPAILQSAGAFPAEDSPDANHQFFIIMMMRIIGFQMDFFRYGFG
jgi:hypothetical protein